MLETLGMPCSLLSILGILLPFFAEGDGNRVQLQILEVLEACLLLEIRV